MLSRELQAEILKLSPSDRLALISVIVESLQDRARDPLDRSVAIRHLRGLLKTDRLAPTDEEIATLLEERRMEKYLS
jgi:hypothetical protein